MLHYEGIQSQSLGILNDLMKVESLNNHTLCGGTALALY